MIAIFMKLDNSSEEQLVRMICSDITAMRGEERLEILTPGSCREKDLFREAAVGFDLIIYHIGGEKELPALYELRRHSPGAKILVIAGRDLSPECYVNSSVMPTELILFPYERNRISGAIRRLINSIYEDRFEGLHSLRFAVRRGDDIIYVPTKEICYFEARNKKILLKGMKREILFWGFLKEIQKRLPRCFARCHRSIIINTLRVESVNWSSGTILMEDHTEIPFSRRYKKDLERSVKDIAA